MNMVKRSGSGDLPDAGAAASQSPGDAAAGSANANSKGALKEKVLQAYELLLKGDDVEAANPKYWDEFFLLK